jgi:hypothetical protein
VSLYSICLDPPTDPRLSLAPQDAQRTSAEHRDLLAELERLRAQVAHLNAVLAEESQRHRMLQVQPALARCSRGFAPWRGSEAVGTRAFRRRKWRSHGWQRLSGELS